MKLRILLTLSILLVSCNNLDGIRIYTTDQDNEAIVRMQDNEIIRCDSLGFNGYKCVSDSDFIKIVRKLKQCNQ